MTFSHCQSRWEKVKGRIIVREKGRFTHDYLFDSHNNCLNKDGDEYEVNHLNQIEQTQNTEYIYDALDRLVRVRKKDQDLIEYVYDSLHRRVIKKQGSKETLYLYQGQNEVGEVEDGFLITFRTLGLTEMAELGSAISMEIEGKVYIPLYDLSLNTAELISEGLEGVESYRYSAFGQEKIEKYNQSTTNPLRYLSDRMFYKNAINPWRYSSKRADEETGYVYFGRRYYDPELGRWTTKDPKGYEEGVNLYAYGLNNPLTMHDLYGLEIEYTCPTMRSNEMQPLRCYSRGICEFAAEALVRPLDMFHMSIASPNFNGQHVEPLKPSEVLLPIYRSLLDKTLPYNKNSNVNVNMVNSTKAFLDSLFTAYLGNINKAGNAYQFAQSMGTRVLNGRMVEGVLGPIVSVFSSVLNKNGLKDSGTEQAFAKESNNWTKGSPFKDRTAEELDALFQGKKYFPIGEDPMNGLGSYIHEKTGRKLYIDPRNNGRFREPSHVDIFRPKKYNGKLRKKRMIYKDE